MNAHSCWPDWMEETLWAKSAQKGAGGKPESLARHTWLVLSRLADFIQLRPALPAQIGAPRLWHILYWAAFLHDFGKAAVWFPKQIARRAKVATPSRGALACVCRLAR